MLWNNCVKPIRRTERFSNENRMVTNRYVERFIRGCAVQHEHDVHVNRREPNYRGIMSDGFQSGDDGGETNRDEKKKKHDSTGGEIYVTQFTRATAADLDGRRAPQVGARRRVGHRRAVR